MNDNIIKYGLYPVIIIIILIIFYFIINTLSTKTYLQHNINKQHYTILELKEELNQIKDSLNNVIGNNENDELYYPPLNSFDPVLQYDMDKLYDPLVDPSQRYVVSQLPTQQIASVTNIATQNIYDSYHRVGLLIAEHCDDNIQIVPENQVLELFSRMIYHYFYQYYTAITMGQKIIKVNINRDSGQEYYNGNIIYIPELRTKYRVQIDVRDQIYYNPYFPNPM